MRVILLFEKEEIPFFSKKQFISISGAIFHNLGQILVALIFYGFNIIYYLPYLIILSLITGSVIGILGQIILAKLPKQLS